MRAATVLLLLVAAAAPEGKPGQVVEGELPAPGTKGDPVAYAVYVATSAPKDKPAPLILALHAGRGSAAQFVGFLRVLAEANGAILAGPRGIRELIGADGWWWKGDRREFDALDRFLEHATKTYRIDEKRITLVGLADGAELGLRWAQAKPRGLQGLVLVNFIFRGGSARALKDTKVCLFACRDAKEKSQLLRVHAAKAGAFFKRAKVPCVVRIVPGASRSFFHGWEKEFRKAYQWFGGTLDWPKELAPKKEEKK